MYLRRNRHFGNNFPGEFIYEFVDNEKVVATLDIDGGRGTASLRKGTFSVAMSIIDEPWIEIQDEYHNLCVTPQCQRIIVTSEE